MRILGLVFAGSSTEHRAAMAAFLRDALSMTPIAIDGVEADVFELPDGSTFAVSSPGGMGQTPRSVGFLVDDLTAAAADLQDSGHQVGPVSENARQRYFHFRAPDQHLYELIEHKAPAGPDASSAIELRAGGLSDLPELMRLAREFYDEDGFATSDVDLDRNFRALLAATSTAHVCLAVRDGSGIGFALTTSQLVLESGVVAELQDLYVLPAYRRQGVAGRLMDDAIRWAQAQRASLLEVVVAPNGRDVSHLFGYYAAQGFRDEGRQLLSREL